MHISFPRRAIEWSIYSLVVIIATGAFQPLFLTIPSSGMPQPSWLYEGFWLSVYLWSLCRLLRRRRQLIDILRANRITLSLIVLAAASTLWSAIPALTFYRSASLGASALVGVDFALTFSPRDQQKLLLLTLAAIVVVGIGLSLFSPTLVPSGASGGGAQVGELWRGPFARRNEFGRIAALVLVLALTSVSDLVSRWFRSIVLIASSCAILMSDSMSALVVVVLAMLFTWALTRHGRTRNLLLLAGAVGICVVVFCSSIDGVTSALTHSIGRDTTLTGRTELWREVIISIRSKPVLGYGYAAFWTTPTADSIRATIGWPSPHAHNGYLDVALDLGIVGVLVFLMSLGIAIVRATRSAGDDRQWSLALLLFSSFYQLSETTIVTSNWILWILFIAVQCNISHRRMSRGGGRGSDAANPSLPFVAA